MGFLVLKCPLAWLTPSLAGAEKADGAATPRCWHVVECSCSLGIACRLAGLIDAGRCRAAKASVEIRGLGINAFEMVRTRAGGKPMPVSLPLGFVSTKGLQSVCGLDVVNWQGGNPPARGRGATVLPC